MKKDFRISMTLTPKAYEVFQAWIETNPELASWIKPHGVKEKLDGRGHPIVEVLTSNRHGGRIHCLPLSGTLPAVRKEWTRWIEMKKKEEVAVLERKQVKRCMRDLKKRNFCVF